MCKKKEIAPGTFGAFCSPIKSARFRMTPCIGEILRLHSKQRIKEQPQSTWLEAYNLRGTGSTFNRKHKVEAIYAR